MRPIHLLLPCLLLSACSAAPPTPPAETTRPYPATVEALKNDPSLRDARVLAATEEQAKTRCTNYSSVMGSAYYPRAAAAQGMFRGDAVIAFTITPTGQLANIRALRASHPVFAEAAVDVVSQYKCTPTGGKELNVVVPFSYVAR